MSAITIVANVVIEATNVIVVVATTLVLDPVIVIIQPLFHHPHYQKLLVLLQ